MMPTGLTPTSKKLILHHTGGFGSKRKVEGTHNVMTGEIISKSLQNIVTNIFR